MKTKSHKSELKSKLKSFQLVGLAVACSVALISFEWKTFQDDYVDLGEIEVEEIPADIIPITYTEKPDLPKPKVTYSPTIDPVDELEELDTTTVEIDPKPMDSAIVFIDEPEKTEKEPKIFVVVEKMPSLPGCEEMASEDDRKTCTQQKMFYQLAKAQKYPQTMREIGMDGTVHVTFVVNKRGKVKDVEVLRGVAGGKALDEEAVRMVRSLPKFNPGMQQGKPVAVRYTLPIKFKLQ